MLNLVFKQIKIDSELMCELTVKSRVKEIEGRGERKKGEAQINN